MFSKLPRNYVSSVRRHCRALVFALSVIGVIIYIAVRKNGSDISTERQLVWKTLKARCGSCSLVTNSGDLIGSYVGTKIDEADCVIRINNAPTTGFEDDVGRKTTIRMVDGENLGLITRSFPAAESIPLHTIVYYDHLSSKHNVEFPHQVTQFGEQASTLLNRNDNILQRVEQSIASALLSRQYMKGKERFSVAFVALIFSHEICRNELNVYGMSAPSYCDKYQDYAHDAPKNYYPPGNEERKCPQSRNLDNILWTSNLDKQEIYAAFELAKLTNKIRFREYTMDQIARRK